MTIYNITLPDNLDITHRVTHGSLSVKRTNGKVSASIEWQAIGSTDLYKAAAFAGTINYLAEHGNSIVAMIESGELETILATQVFTNGKGVFIAMEADERGVLGFDIQKKSVEYHTYGNLLYDYDERYDITTERERNQQDYANKLPKYLNERDVTITS